MIAIGKAELGIATPCFAAEARVLLLIAIGKAELGIATLTMLQEMGSLQDRDRKGRVGYCDPGIRRGSMRCSQAK